MDAWVAVFGLCCLIAGYLLGYRERKLWDAMQQLQRPPELPTGPPSAILEPPLTPAERVAREQEELLDRLNPR